VSHLLNISSTDVAASFDSDICLLTLTDALEFNEFVGPVKMPEQGEEFTGDAVVSGWGTTSSGGSTPDELRYVTVPLVDDASKFQVPRL
jgi:hypothetical protein